MKTVYHYTQATGEFLFSEPAFESPLEPGVYIIPAFATTSKPTGKTIKGQVEIFDGQVWKFVNVGNPEQFIAPAPTEEQLVAASKNHARQLLADTEWTQARDVYALLKNAKDFDAYRAEVRAIFFNPVSMPDWPAAPTPEWKN